MRPVGTEFASPQARRAARYLGKLVREARLARHMPQSELAARARTTQATVHRLEHGSIQSSLSIWFSVMEQLGLLDLIMELQDPKTDALRAEQGARRARRRTRTDELDF
jgi:transcriptional regulator with XRE-family HTH domain